MQTLLKHFFNYNIHHKNSKLIFGYENRSDVNISKMVSFWKLLYKRLGSTQIRLTNIEYIKVEGYTIYGFDGQDSTFLPINYILRYPYRGKFNIIEINNNLKVFSHPKFRNFKSFNGVSIYNNNKPDHLITLNNTFDQNYEIHKYELNDLIYMLEDFYPGDNNLPIWGNIYNREVSNYLISKLPTYINPYEFLNKIIIQYLINLKWSHSSGSLYYGYNGNIVEDESLATIKEIRPIEILGSSYVDYCGYVYIIDTNNVFINGVLV